MSRRIRKHANPFSVRVLLGHLDRQATFGRVGPLEVEIGAGAGHFLWDRALANPGVDFVGLEIREQLVHARMKRTDRPANLVFLVANANTNIALAPAGEIKRFHVHFPDPCFRKRHYKRRTVQPVTVRAMTEVLPIGGQIYAQSDVRLLAEEMYRFFAADGALESKLGPGMEVERPFPQSTDWERQHEREGAPIYRMLFEKVREPSGPIPDLELGEVVRHEDEVRAAEAEEGAEEDAREAAGDPTPSASGRES